MERIRENPMSYIAGSIVVVAGLFIAERFNYLLFHSLAELFSIIIAVTLFLIMWNSKKYMENKALVFISIGYLFIASLDLLHTLSYQGMSIFKDYDFYANQLWIAARYMESLTLLIAYAWPGRVNQLIRKVGTIGLVAIFFLITVLLVASIFVWKTFPICFIANQGQTGFKIISEYIICLILFAGVLLLWKNRGDFDKKIYTLLIASMFFTILQELSFTLYTDNYGILNMIGHYFKILSFYLMYRAIVKTGIIQPYNLVFRELTINQMKLKEAKNAAEEANNMKSTFLASMSHEIRTPLNSILGFTHILFEEERSTEKLEKLEIIKNAGSHLLSLVNNVLEFSKIEAGKIEIERRSFSLHKLMDDLQKMFTLKAQERNLSWEVHIGPTVPEIMVGDEHRIMQVLVNLTGNAFKFTEFGGVFIQVSYQNGQLEVLVKDTGIGIPEEKQEAIFSAFEQVDASYARKYAGTGLGLSITRNLLDLMGGTIRVKKSTVGGSEFVVSLPAETVETFEENPTELAVLAETEPNSAKRVVLLVVDRNESTDIEAIMNIVQVGSLEGVCVKVLPFDSKAKDKVLAAGADLVLLYENPENCTMKRLSKDLEQDFRTSFLPIILLKAGSGEQISFQPDPNTQKYGSISQDEGFYGFIRQVIRGREAFGEAMVKGWLEKLVVELGTHEILLESLNDIASRVESLETALVNQVMEDIKFLTHSLKGGTGTLRMQEVSQKLADMEAELRRVPLDMERVKKEFSSVKEMLGLIPKKYFDMEQLELEIQKDSLGELLILVVDDNRENNKLIGHLLNRLNLRYKNAENGAVALEMLHSERYDLVLLDAQMPIMDGITTLKRIREDSALKGLRVIMQSASIFEEDIKEFFRAGCDDYITKPIDLGVLQRKIEETIARRNS